MTTPRTTAAKILSIAASQIGIREGRDANGNWNNRVKYTTWYANHPLIRNNAFLTSAWCAIFVSWVADQAGVVTSLIPMHAWTPSGLAWFQKRGLVSKGTGARPGDVVYFYYPTKGRVAHVGFVEKVGSDGYITTIEGNTNTSGSSQGNGVYRLRRKITSNMYFCHPQYALATTPPTVVAKPAPTVRKAQLVKQVSVRNLQRARFEDPPKNGEPLGAYANEVFTLETALAKTKWLRLGLVDGHYGSSTVKAAQGFQRKHSGADNPDGWLGRKELLKLFALARMYVRVAD